MNTNKETARNLLDVRIVLAALWIAEVSSSLNGDTYRLSDPITLKSMLENTGSIVTTPGLLLTMSMIFVVPILMSALTLILKSSVSRWANRIIGILYALITFAFLVLWLLNRKSKAKRVIEYLYIKVEFHGCTRFKSDSAADSNMPARF